MQNVISEWNKQRKANKNKWVFFESCGVRIKSYNLWIQRVEFKDFIDGYNGNTVKGANSFLENFLSH